MNILKSFRYGRATNTLFVVYDDGISDDIEEYFFLRDVRSINKKLHGSIFGGNVVPDLCYSITLTFEGGISHTFSKRITAFRRSDFYDKNGQKITKPMKLRGWEKELAVTPPTPCNPEFFVMNESGEYIEAELIYNLWNELFPNHQS